MKKLLSFLVVMVALTAMLNAQSKITRPTGATNVPMKISAVSGNEVAPENGIPQFIRAANTSAIGVTYYDAVTNGLSRNTIVNWADGSVAAVWTMAQVSAQRGTGYNYNNGTTWGPQPDPTTGRIETVRTGWGVIASLNDGEIVAAHNGATGLTINKRATKGTGAWTETTLVGPGHDGDPANTVLLWPTIATQGDTVHIFACTDNVEGVLYSGKQTPILYYRSTDGGTTWSAPQLIAAMDSNNKEMADNYSIVAKNGKLVLLISEKFAETFYLESNDRGNTWTKHTVYPFAGGPDFDFTTGTFPMTVLNDLSASIAIGDDGTVHIAFGGLMGARDSENAQDEYSVWWAYDNIIYWNSTMAPFAVPFDTNTVEAYAGRIGRPNLDGDDTIWFMDGYTQPEYRSNGPITFPNLVAEGGKVYMVYAALLEAPYLSGATSEYYNGIFATVSENNGTTWDDLNNVSWLSYHPDMYFVDWEQTELYGELMTIMEGESFWPGMAHNSSNGKLNIMWYFDYIPGQTGGFGTSATSIYAVNIDKESVGDFKNTTEIYQALWNQEGIKENTLTEMKIYPNPASNNVTIVVASKEVANANLVVTNLMGQVVYTQNVSLETGSNQYSLNVSNFSAGFYLVNIRTNAGSTTQKLIVE